jgi:hypothetical protein
MRIAALALSVIGMIAALGRHARSPVHAVAALGMGTIMLALLVAPGFSSIAASCLGMVLLLVVLARVVGVRVASRHPLDTGQRTAAAVSVVDIGFMSVAVLLMPAHAIVRGAALVSPMAGHGSGAPALTAGLMVWIVLLSWSLCVGLIIGPALRNHAPAAPFHLVCSASMIAAMAAMVG